MKFSLALKFNQHSISTIKKRATAITDEM